MKQTQTNHTVIKLSILTLVISLLLTTLIPGSANGGTWILEEYADLPAGSSPGGLVYGPGQSLWVTGLESESIYKINSAVNIEEIQLPTVGGLPFDATIGPDRYIWVSDQNLASLYKAVYGNDPQMESFEFSKDPNLDVTELVVGQDEAVWFTAYEADQIGRFNELQGFTLLDLNEGTRPLGITNDTNGNIWFTGWGSYQLGKVNLDGDIEMIDLSSRLYRPAEIIRDTDGDLWFTYDIGTRISRINPTTQTIDHFTITTDSNAIMDLHLGPDGRLWLLGTNSLGSFDITEAGPANYHETLFDAPVFEGNGRSQITSGGDGYIYYTRLDRDKVYRAEATAATLRDLQINIKRMTDYILVSGPFYTMVEITNWSNQPADNVELTIHLDQTINFDSIKDLDPVNCSTVDDQVSCAVGTIPANTTQTYQINFITEKPTGSETERTLIFTTDLAGGDYYPENNQVQRSFQLIYKFEYNNDFSQSAEEELWSHTQLKQPNLTQSYLGEFSNDNVSLTFKNLPKHDRINTCFQLYINGAWDGDQFINPEDPGMVIGPDIWTYYIDENAIIVTTFSNQAEYQQAFPENYRDGSFPAQTGNRQLGDFDGDGEMNDARYDFCYTKIHTAEELKFTFYGVNLTGEAGEEWGIDTVHVEIYNYDAFHWIHLPMMLR